MKTNGLFFGASAALLVGALFQSPIRAEEPKPNEAPKADAPANEERRDRGPRGGGDRGMRGGDRGPGGGGDRGPGGGGRGFGGGPGGPGGYAERLGGAVSALNRQSPLAMSNWILGFEIEDPKQAQSRMRSLPLGADKKQTLHVPVGGVANPGAQSGWKVEAVFKLTEEQTKSLEAIRKEYDDERLKLEGELAEQQKAMAAKAAELRKKYEVRANDVLAGADKESKQKIDTLTQEAETKTTDLVKETLPLYDLNDQGQALTMMRALREKVNKIAAEAETKLLEALPTESRPKIEEILKKQAEQREQVNRWNQGGGPRRRGEEGQQDQNKKPEDAPPANF